MLVISYGIPKSGSTLAYELIRRVLISAGHDQELLHHSRARSINPDPKRNFIGRTQRDIVAALIEKIGPSRVIAMKTHGRIDPANFTWFEERQRAGDIRVIASFRDPRDVALSLLDAGKRAGGRGPFAEIVDLEIALDRVETRLKDFRLWAALEGTLRLNYEDLAFAPDKAISAIEQALGVSADHEEVIRYVFTEARTLRNKATPRRHETELDAKQAEALRQRFHRFLSNVIESDSQAWFDKYRKRTLRRSAREAASTKS